MILLDINTPYQNSEQLLKEIRKKSNIPVIIVTSRNTGTDEILSISYGADNYITKPYNPTILLLRIQNIFKRLRIIQSNRSILLISIVISSNSLHIWNKFC